MFFKHLDPELVTHRVFLRPLIEDDVSEGYVSWLLLGSKSLHRDPPFCLDT